MQIGFLESLNGRLRDECLNEHLFVNLRLIRELIATWCEDCDHHHPHSSLDGHISRDYNHQKREGQALNRAN